jgi:hypothetical protein
MTDEAEAQSINDEKPLTWLELWFVFAASTAILIILMTLRLVGTLETPALLIGSLPLATIALTRSTRAFYAPACWINRKLDERNSTEHLQTSPNTSQTKARHRSTSVRT